MSSLWDRRPRSDRVDCQFCGCLWFASLFDACPGCAERDERKVIDLRTRLAERDNDVLRERFEARFVRGGPDECWDWQGTITQGYGRLQVGGYASPILAAHRLAYEFYVGPIPEGLVIDHLCRNRRCVNPAHMEPVTNAENVLRGEGPTAQNARKTHCHRGHSLDEHARVNRDGKRQCRLCVNLRLAEKRAAKDAEQKDERAARDRLRPRSGNVQAAPQRRPTVGESFPPSWLSGGGSAPSDDDDPGPVAA